MEWEGHLSSCSGMTFVGLRASAVAEDDVEGDVFAFAEGFIIHTLDCAVMDEDVGATVVAAEKAEALGVTGGC